MSEKKMVRRSVAIALGLVCIVLVAFTLYLTVTDILAQISYFNLQNQNEQLQTLLYENASENANLQNQNSQLQTWLAGNETLLLYMSDWLVGNITSYETQISSLNAGITQLQTWLDGKEILLNQTQANNTNLQNQMNNLTDILSLNKSTIWYNGTLQIMPPLELTMLNENAPFPGYVSVHASSPPTNETIVELIYYSEVLNFRHDESINLGSNGTAIFPVLPSDMSIYFSDPQLLYNSSRTANVTITYYY